MLLNKNLAEYSNVGVALNLEYQRAKRSLSGLKRQFNAWWDAKYINIRHQLNPIDLAGTKWSSQKEIEMEVRCKYSEEFIDWDTKIQDLEMRVAFLNSLRDQWQDHLKVIINLSQNMRQEMMALPTEIVRREKANNIT